MRFTLITTCLLFLTSLIYSQASNGYGSEKSSNIYETVRNLAFQQNDLAQALSLLDSEIIRHPKDLQLKIFKSKLYFWNNLNHEATTQLVKLLEINPDNYKAYNLLADIYETQGLFLIARDYLMTGLSYYHNDEQLLFRVAYNLQQTQEYKSALAYCKKVIKINDKNEKAISLKKVLDSKLNKNIIIAAYRNNFLNTTDQNLTFYNLQFGRKINKTTIIGGVQSTKTNQGSGLQYNLEMYNVLDDKFYTYVNFGFSNSTFFPTSKMSIAMYKTMNRNFEASFFLNLLKLEDATLRILAPSISKYHRNSMLTSTFNLISDGQETELTYRFRYRQFLKNHTSYAGIAFGSFSRDETIGYNEENPFTDKYISYETQLSIKNIIIGLNYNRNLNKFARSRDQFTTYLKQSF